MLVLDAQSIRQACTGRGTAVGVQYGSRSCSSTPNIQELLDCKCGPVRSPIHFQGNRRSQSRGVEAGKIENAKRSTLKRRLWGNAGACPLSAPTAKEAHSLRAGREVTRRFRAVKCDVKNPRGSTFRASRNPAVSSSDCSDPSAPGLNNHSWAIGLFVIPAKMVRVIQNVSPRSQVQ